VVTAAQEIGERAGAETLASVADVTVLSDVERLAGIVRERWGGVDVLVNNAATLGPVGDLVDVSPEDWLRALTGNVGSVAMVSHFMIPLMPVGGSIINLSGAGVGGSAIPERVSAYPVSKAAVVMLTEALAGECASRGIRVNAVAPGAVATRFLDAILEAGPERAGDRTFNTASSQPSLPNHLDSYLRLVVWLASPESSWLTGKLLSARWDSIERLEGLRPSITESSLLTLRRIDGELFAPVDPSDKAGRRRPRANQR
jgi:NAD(P)-dependent dehydrogenase (short-subunit alcohol dehydrogenase family)